MICEKKILVTGGAGFVGSHLCSALSIPSLKNHVVSLDDYSIGVTRNHQGGVEYISGSTTDVFKLIDFTPDIVLHLGEYSRVEQSFEDWETVWLANKLGTKQVLDFACSANAKFIYAGSSTKFGDGGLGANSSPYGWSKSSNTDLVINYGSWFGLSYAIVYFYNVFGPREVGEGKYATLIARFAQQMKKKKPLTVVLPGTQKRNFTHVEDIVRGLLLVAENGTGDGHGIGSDESFSVKDVADLFGGPVEYLPPRRGNRMGADLLNEKVKALGWQWKYSLSDYIQVLRERGWEIDE